MQRYIPLTDLKGWTLGRKMGEGAFGTVFSVYTPEDERFAVKKQKIFRLIGNQPSLLRETLNEIAILKRIKDADSYIVPLLAIFITEHMAGPIMPLLESLHTLLIERRIEPDSFPLYIYQITHGLAYLHSRNIYHKDLKPQNILYDRERDEALIADFGASTALSCSSTTILTEDVVTLWYRPPEILLGGKAYEESADIWSLGCIIYELFTRSVLFPSYSKIEQLFKIFSILGTPTEREWPGVSHYPYYDEKTFPRFRSGWDKLKEKIPEEWLDLLQTLLVFLPKGRRTTFDILSLPLFDEYREERIPSPISCLHNLFLREIEYKTRTQNTSALSQILTVSRTLKMTPKVFFLAAELIQKYVSDTHSSLYPISILMVSQAFLEHYPIDVSDYILVLDLPEDIKERENLLRLSIEFLRQSEFNLVVSTSFDFLEQFIRLFYPEDIQEIALYILYDVVITGPNDLRASQQALVAIYHACSRLNIEYKNEKTMREKDILRVTFSPRITKE